MIRDPRTESLCPTLAFSSFTQVGIWRRWFWHRQSLSCFWGHWWAEPCSLVSWKPWGRGRHRLRCQQCRPAPPSVQGGRSSGPGWQRAPALVCCRSPAGTLVDEVCLQRGAGGAGCSTAPGKTLFCQLLILERMERIGWSCAQSQSLQPGNHDSIICNFSSTVSHLLDFMVGARGSAKCETRVLGGNPLGRLGHWRLGGAAGFRLGGVSVGGVRIKISAARKSEEVSAVILPFSFFHPTKI